MINPKPNHDTLSGDLYKRTGRAKQDITAVLRKAEFAKSEISVNDLLQETMALYGVGRKSLMEFIEHTVKTLGGEIHGDEIEWPLSQDEIAALIKKKEEAHNALHPPL